MDEKAKNSFWDLYGKFYGIVILSLGFLLLSRLGCAIFRVGEMIQAQISGFVPDNPILAQLLNWALFSVVQPSARDAFWDFVLFSLTLFVVMFVVTGIVLPTPQVSQRLSALLFLLSPDQPFIQAAGGEFSSNLTDATKKYQGPGVILADSVTALVLEKDEKFSRVVGPGLTFFEEDRIHASLDLRPQNIRRRATMNTRDGIRVEIDFNIGLEVVRGINNWQPTMARYPYNPDAVFRAVYAEHAKTKNAKEMYHRVVDWCDSIGEIAENALREKVATYTLDQLFAVDDPLRMPDREIKDHIQNMLNPVIVQLGGSLRSVSISNMRPPKEVLKQRIESWKKDWQSRQETIQALGSAEQQQNVESVRALVQGEMAQSIADAIAQAPAANTPEFISLRLIQALEKMAENSKGTEQVNNNILDILRQIEKE